MELAAGEPLEMRESALGVACGVSMIMIYDLHVLDIYTLYTYITHYLNKYSTLIRRYSPLMIILITLENL